MFKKLDPQINIKSDEDMLLSDNNEMAPDEGPLGIDRWSSNGYGVSINGKKVIPTDAE